MDNLLQNRLFLSYLSGAGGALQAGKPISAGIDPITQQNIAAQSKAKLNKQYIEMMRNILKGGGDIKLGKDTTDVKIPSGMYGGLGSELARPDEDRMSMYPQESEVGEIAKALRGEETVEGIATGLRTEAPPLGPMLGEMSTDRTSYLNPSASPLDDLTGADLAGLTAADVSQALSGAISVQGLKSDIGYKGQLMRESAARIRQMERPVPPKDERTTAMKNYEFSQSIEGGSFKGTFEEWEKDAKTTYEKHFERAVDEGYKGNFQEWLRDITALGGGLSLGEKVAEKEAFADVKARKDFVANLAKDVDKFASSSVMRQKVNLAEAEKEGSGSVTQRLEIAKYIEKGIISRGGTILGEPRMEGRIRIWDVRWSDGAEEEVRYPF